MLTYFFFFASAVAFAFLLYSLLSREELGISFTHPRIIVEATLFLLFLTIGLVRLLR